MNKLINYLIILSLCAVCFASSATAANFCVENTNQLYLSLSIADSNNQADHIRITTGTYQIQASPFIYDATITQDVNDLQISGGWSQVGTNPCGQQFETTAFDTVLDGNDVNVIMSLEMAGNANLDISNLFFYRGNGGSGLGGGLVIGYPTGTEGYVLIENNAFISNSGGGATALFVDVAETTTVRNNSFADNHAATSHIIRINSGSDGIYFTNNTVVSNTNDNILSQPSVSLRFDAPLQAFVANNVFWDNQDSDMFFSGGHGYSYFKNNDYQSLGMPVNEIDEFNGNFTLDPQFQAIGPVNTHIPLLTSPLINAGIKNPGIVGVPPDFDETWYIGDTDILGNNRILDDTIDIGAYEVSVEGDIIFENGFE